MTWDTEVTAVEEQKMLVLLNQYKISAILVAADELGVLDKLSSTDVAVAELAGELRCKPSRLQRLLYGLQALDLVKCEQGRVSFTSLGFAVSQGRLRSHIQVASDYLKSWAQLAECLKEDRAPDAWTARRVSQVKRTAFYTTMKEHSQEVAQLVLQVAPEKGTLVDAGGGKGHVLRAVLGERPKLHGVLFDFPEVIEDVQPDPSWVAVGGSLFDPPEIAEKRECYLLANVLHDWDDSDVEEIVRELSSAASGCSPQQLLIVERVVQPGFERFVALPDLHMMAVTGGRQRTVKELHDLVAKHGWRPGAVVMKDPVGSFTLVEAIR